VSAPHESTGAWDGRLAVVANPGAFIRLVPKNEQRRSDFRHDLNLLRNSAKLSQVDGACRGRHRRVSTKAFLNRVLGYNIEPEDSQPMRYFRHILPRFPPVSELDMVFFSTISPLFEAKLAIFSKLPTGG